MGSDKDWPSSGASRAACVPAFELKLKLMSKSDQPRERRPDLRRRASNERPQVWGPEERKMFIFSPDSVPGPVKDEALAQEGQRLVLRCAAMLVVCLSVCVSSG